MSECDNIGVRLADGVGATAKIQVEGEDQLIALPGGISLCHLDDPVPAGCV